jgi:hypothetical protein
LEPNPETAVSLPEPHWEAAVKSALAILFCLALGGCAVAAAPCRVASDAIRVAPVVGNAAAAPTDACADTIDPAGPPPY